jgi:hypothetical protein
VPDDWGSGPRLVVLPSISSYSRGDDGSNSHGALRAAEEILHKRGDQPRQKQNRLVFLAADYDVVSRLNDQTRTYLAWNSILEDFQSNKLVYQSNQLAEVKRAVEGAQQTLQQLVREAYKWLICPVEEFVRGKPSLEWEVVSVSPAAQNLVQEIENKLREEEWLISEWSPIHLRNMLNQWYFKDGVTEVSALKVYQDSCNYLYLPRLQNDHVLKHAIERGLETEDFFGFAAGKEGDKHLGFVFGRNTMITLDESALLIERDTAAEYKESIKPAPQPEPGANGDDSQPGERPKPDGGVQPQSGDDASTAPTPDAATKKQFYGTISLEPVGATMQFKEIVDEVVQQFTSKLGVDVKISVEIEAECRDGFDEAMQRTIKENCNVLRFSNAEFEEGE